MKENKSESTESFTNITERSIANNIDDKSHFSDHPLNKSSSCVRSALHKAVCRGSLQEVRHLFDSLSTDTSDIVNNNEQQLHVLNAIDSHGFCPIHSAVSLSPIDMAVVMTRLLLAWGTDSSSTDKFGNSPLHWAARAGNDEVAQTLLLKHCSPGKNCTLLHIYFGHFLF
jgi:ankyrin repeat protein